MDTLPFRPKSNWLVTDLNWLICLSTAAAWIAAIASGYGRGVNTVLAGLIGTAVVILVAGILKKRLGYLLGCLICLDVLMTFIPDGRTVFVAPDGRTNLHRVMLTNPFTVRHVPAEFDLSLPVMGLTSDNKEVGSHLMVKLTVQDERTAFLLAQDSEVFVARLKAAVQTEFAKEVGLQSLRDVNRNELTWQLTRAATEVTRDFGLKPRDGYRLSDLYFFDGR